MFHDDWGVTSLLESQPRLRIRPGYDVGLCIEGLFHLNAEWETHGAVEDDFRVLIVIPPDYPNSLPRVFETQGRIPAKFHKLDDESLCLGAAIRCFKALHCSHRLDSYLDECLVPYFFQYVMVERGHDLPIGDLAHGPMGILEFYRSELWMPSGRSALEALRLLGMPMLEAHEAVCPCGSGRRLAECHSYFADRLRSCQIQKWFKGEYQRLRAWFMRGTAN